MVQAPLYSWWQADTQLHQLSRAAGAAFIFGVKAATVAFRAAPWEIIFGVSLVEFTWNAAYVAIIYICTLSVES